MKLDEAILKRMINELKDNLFAVNSLRKTFLKQCDDLKRILDDIGPEFVKQRVDLKRILDEFEFGRATVCDEDGRRFKVVIDGLLYYADEPKVKTIHEKTGEVVIGGFYRDGQRKGD